MVGAAITECQRKKKEGLIPSEAISKYQKRKLKSYVNPKRDSAVRSIREVLSFHADLKGFWSILSECQGECDNLTDFIDMVNGPYEDYSDAPTPPPHEKKNDDNDDTKRTSKHHPHNKQKKENKQIILPFLSYI